LEEAMAQAKRIRQEQDKRKRIEQGEDERDAEARLITEYTDDFGRKRKMRIL
jgi:hypothetical protein